MATLRNIHWDFDGDGDFEKTGIEVSHIITEATNQDIKVSVNLEVYNYLSKTLYNITRKELFKVSGYNALMSITLDDGHITGYTQAYPLLQSKNLSATPYIVPQWIGMNSNYMTWDDVSDLKNGGWDIQSHGKGANLTWGHNYCNEQGIPFGHQCNKLVIHPTLGIINTSRIIEELNESRKILEEKGYNITGIAYPGGNYSQESLNLTAQYYNYGRSIFNKYNPLPENVNRTTSPKLTNLYTLSVFGAISSRNYNDYVDIIDGAIENHSWLIFNLHVIKDPCTGGGSTSGGCINLSLLNKTIDYALNNNVKIVTMDEAMTGSWKNN